MIVTASNVRIQHEEALATLLDNGSLRFNFGPENFDYAMPDGYAMETAAPVAPVK
jgi:hypothetical protein